MTEKRLTLALMDPPYESANLLAGVRMIKVGALPDLLEEYDQVWHW